MAFRRNVEAAIGQKDDGPQEQEWREMWKNTNSSWAEFEGMNFKYPRGRSLTLFSLARWRKEEAQRRTTARNDDSHFYTAHSESRGPPVVSSSTRLPFVENESDCGPG